MDGLRRPKGAKAEVLHAMDAVHRRMEYWRTYTEPEGRTVSTAECVRENLGWALTHLDNVLWELEQTETAAS